MRLSPSFASGAMRHSIAALLAALVLLILVTPFVEGLPHGRGLEALLLSLVLIAAVVAVARERWIFIAAAVLFLPAMVNRWLNHFYPNDISAVSFFCFGILFIAFAAGCLLRFIVASMQVDTEVICAGISIYLLLGLLWSLAYLLLEQLSPGSFSVADAGGTNLRFDPFNAFYLSFGTLSTLGAVDVSPLSRPARTLMVMEAITGTFYIAILISRLVAMYSPTRRTNPGGTA
jgi:hypothetical protein